MRQLASYITGLVTQRFRRFLYASNVFFSLFYIVHCYNQQISYSSKLHLVNIPALVPHLIVFVLAFYCCSTCACFRHTPSLNASSKLFNVYSVWLVNEIPDTSFHLEILTVHVCVSSRLIKSDTPSLLILYTCYKYEQQ